MRLVVVAGAVAAIGALPLPAGGTDRVVNGHARGQLARVVPYVGLPGVGAAAGVAQADVDGSAARASAGVADFGPLGLILGQLGAVAPVPVPALPSTVSADSSGEPSVVRHPLARDDVPGGAEIGPAAAREEAHANHDPSSWAAARGPELGVPGLFVMTGGQSRATATATATTATVTVGRLALGPDSPLGGPVVVLSDLTWTARQEMDRLGQASFTVGAVTVAGRPLPPADTADLAGVVETANAALVPTGLHLEAPVTTADAAGGSVSSLVIQVRNPEAVADLLAGAAQPALPALTPVLDALLDGAPDEAGAARFVVNALLASATGRAGGRLELGGAAARLGTVEVAVPPRLEAPPLPVLPPPAPAAVPAPPAPPIETHPAADGGFVPAPPPPAAPPAPPGAAHSPVTDAAPGGSNLAALPAGTPDRPGGASAPLVLAAALGAVVLLAAGDKLRLRRVARGIPS